MTGVQTCALPISLINFQPKKEMKIVECIFPTHSHPIMYMVSWFVLILSLVVLLNAFVTQSLSDSTKSSKKQKMLAENLIQHYVLLSLTYTAEI